MVKIKKFFAENGYLIMSVFMLFIMFKTCNQNNSIKSLDKEMKSLVIAQDSMALSIRKEIKVEGLRAESRMIQATDRKMLDVQRQNEIEAEIKLTQKN